MPIWFINWAGSLLSFLVWKGWENVNLIMNGEWNCEHNGVNYKVSYSFNIFQLTLSEIVASFVLFRLIT